MFTYTIRPPTIVAATAPLSVHPSKGVFFDFETNAAALIVTGVSGERNVRSAGSPIAGDGSGTTDLILLHTIRK